jgi:hypothetical protein
LFETGNATSIGELTNCEEQARAFQNMGSQSQQVVLNDGDGGAYFGMMASSAASTVTLAADP